ncbi:MAG TPA: heme-binding beta-barrel domain-containing protein, partial [Caulobacteraceae bacterium]|nr:heme-binding beta-barrel domain-containing protein [Caulobacteraceae bacterium]
MDDYPADIFTETPDLDPDTLANLGPLRALAGVWEGRKGVDVNPKAAGPETASFIERIEMQPIDPQSNGPQLLYGLRYHVHILKPGEDNTYHDQVGYWLWEPATGLLMQTLAIPRGQVALAVGQAARDATTFKVSARRGQSNYGIASTDFLEYAFRTD